MTPTNTEFIVALLALVLIAIALLWLLLASVAMWWRSATATARHAVTGYIDRQAWYDDSHFY